MVCVAPNSSIIYISRCYTGHISDKALTKESGFLDELPSYSSIMADKGFNLSDECTVRNIHFIVPPGRGDASQMTPSKVSKTSAIDKVRILVEQVIRIISSYSSIMADKGFNLSDECTVRNIHFIVPPGRGDASQMTPSKVSKTSAIDKVRILVEQVIRIIKTFKILTTEMSISMLENVDDFVLVCVAICKFKEPMYSD